MMFKYRLDHRESRFNYSNQFFRCLMMRFQIFPSIYLLTPKLSGTKIYYVFKLKNIKWFISFKFHWKINGRDKETELTNLDGGERHKFNIRTVNSLPLNLVLFLLNCRSISWIFSTFSIKLNFRKRFSRRSKAQARLKLCFRSSFHCHFHHLLMALSMFS